ncbi:MAG: lytic transglycosylase domain-containing protein, partial [Bacteroidales bacterium]|nr:lytic transglycosylase domain-containing protein [Bacteroidales bacterium]
MRRILLAILLLTAATSCITARTQRDTVSFATDSLRHPKAPGIPDYVVFAGDTVRLDRPDFRERLDRELLSFTYMHSSSTMILKRAPRIFAQVEPILRVQGVHDDLKYLAVIESNLDPKAYSRAGAAGLWQFMKSAAATYNLEVSQEVDERYNIDKETVAACQYLKNSYRRYGDWMTAAASYNAGPGNINKAIAEQKQSSALDLWL